jgi:hypothetical protein
MTKVYILVMVINNFLFFLINLLVLLTLVDAWVPCNAHCDEGKEYLGKCENDTYIHYSTTMMFYCLERLNLVWPF